MVLYYMFKKIALSLCFTLFLGLLTACSPKNPLHLIKGESDSTQVAEKTESSPKNTQKNDGISTPVALPPAYNTQPPKPGQTDTVYMPNGLPALKPMKGINADTLFSENIKDTGDRFNRVENAVVDLRKEFEVYKPSIVRLAAVESDIQNLIKELEVLSQETPNHQQPLDLMRPSEQAQLQVEQLDPQPPPPPEPQKVAQRSEVPPPPKVVPKATAPPKAVVKQEEKPPEKPVVASKPPDKPPKYDGVVALNLRVGEHADKLRIVLDTNKRTSFRIDLDNDEKLIIIELPDARWLDAKSKGFSHSALLESYSIEPLNGGKGTMIIMSLKKATQIMQEKRLSPDKSNYNHRIYFDLKL